MEFNPFDPIPTPEADVWEELIEACSHDALEALGDDRPCRCSRWEDDDVW